MKAKHTMAGVDLRTALATAYVSGARAADIAKPTVDLSIYGHVSSVVWIAKDLDPVVNYWEKLGLKNVQLTKRHRIRRSGLPGQTSSHHGQIGVRRRRRRVHRVDTAGDREQPLHRVPQAARGRRHGSGLRRRERAGTRTPDSIFPLERRGGGAAHPVAGNEGHRRRRCTSTPAAKGGGVLRSPSTTDRTAP